MLFWVVVLKHRNVEVFTQGVLADCTASRHKLALMLESGGEEPINHPCHHWPPSEPRPPSREPPRRSRIYNIIQFLPPGGDAPEVMLMLGLKKKSTSKNWWARMRKKRERDLRCAFDKIFKCLCPSGSCWNQEALWNGQRIPLSKLELTAVLISCHVWKVS